MKKLINTRNSKLLGLALLMAVSSSCSDALEGINQSNLKAIPQADLVQDFNEGGFLLPTMMSGIVSPGTGNQTQQNLLAESYANYLEAPSNFLGNVNPMTYVTATSWTGAYTIPTTNIMNNWLTMKKKGYDTKYPDLYAIALILKVAGGHRIVDSYGPYPYSTYGSSAAPKFDSVPEAYAQFFADLDIAIASLQAAKKADPSSDALRFKKWDVSTLGGDYNKWVKVANTLRLRLAMRLAAGNPTLSKTQAEKACLPASGGFLDETTGNFSVISPDGTSGHYTMTNAWSDTRISAAVVTYLQGYGDPRLPAYVKPATDALLSGDYRGIRPGPDRPTKEVYVNYSQYNVAQAQPMKQIDGAEAYFLKAEGALRGYNVGGGTPQSLYEAGINASMKLNGVSIGNYLSSTTQQLAYVDPAAKTRLTPAKNYDSPRLTDNVVKWDESATDAQKLEKIITQKWIAVFPEGTEAWSEFRRTGYPKLYPILEIKNSLFTQGQFIKRLTYPSSVVSASGESVKAAVTAYLNGKDDEKQTFYWMSPLVP
jgi:hypothetical protein